MLEKLAEENRTSAFVVCGDLNADPWERAYEAVASLERPRLASAYRESLGGGREEPRWTTWKRRSAPEKGVTEKRRCIDYVWYSKGEEEQRGGLRCVRFTFNSQFKKMTLI